MPSKPIGPVSDNNVYPLSPEKERALQPNDRFKECDVCPEMVVVPAVSFTIGSPASEPGRSDDEGPQHKVTVDSFEPNPFGLYQVHGNVFEFVEDCHNKSHAGAPTDGSARTSGDCAMRVRRGGSWYSYAALLRSANRSGWDAALNRDSDVGFRLARTLQP